MGEVPEIRGCGCVHLSYRGIQFLISECDRHDKGLMRTVEENQAIIDRRVDQREGTR